MAAVLALVMLPIIAAVGFFVGGLRTDASIVTVAAGFMFVALAGFVLANAFYVVRQAEGPER